MVTAVSSISLFNLGMVCDFVLEDIKSRQDLLKHYAQFPTPHKTPLSPRTKVWHKKEEGRLWRYIYLSTAIIRHELYKIVEGTRASATTCSLYHDIFEFSYKNFPCDVFYHFLYSCSVGMNLSTEALVQAAILFSKLMSTEANRNFFLNLESLHLHSCCQQTENKSTTHLANSHVTSICCDHEFGASTIWCTLESELRKVRADSRSASSIRHCSCFSRMDESKWHSLQWSVFEGALGCTLATLCLVVKLFEDTLWSNRCWSKLSGFSVADVNGLEISAFERLNFTIFVSSDQYFGFLLDFCGSRCSAQQKANHRKSGGFHPSHSHQSLTELETQHLRSAVAMPQTIPAKEIIEERVHGPTLTDIMKQQQQQQQQNHQNQQHHYQQNHSSLRTTLPAVPVMMKSGSTDASIPRNGSFDLSAKDSSTKRFGWDSFKSEIAEVALEEPVFNI
eukprot:c7093_g1_i1.p1 GENE.c7093_g1_i1~~c7093_g1_i1.p1  ORF type:complete len:449 (-),score=103.11 c7093_g1_i1:97-1443(-)